MCTASNPNIGLLRINKYEYKIPVCHVTCCDMEKREMDDWIEHVTQPIQAAFQAKQLEVQVQDLTIRLRKISKAVEKQQLKKV